MGKVENYEPEQLHKRYARQVFGGVQGQPGGPQQGTIGASGNLYNSNGHNLDGRVQASQQFNPRGPVAVGGGLDYTAPRGGASVDVNHQRGFGTNVNAQGRANLYTSPNTRTTVDAVGNYNQNFGPRSRPDYNVGVGFKHRF